MSAEQTTELPGARSASGWNQSRSAVTVSSTNSTGLSGAVSLAVSSHAGSQTTGSDRTSRTSIVSLGVCCREIIFEVDGKRDTRSSESSGAGVRCTCLDLFRVKAVALCKELITLPDSVARSTVAASGLTGGSSRTGSADPCSQRVNQL